MPAGPGGSDEAGQPGGAVPAGEPVQIAGQPVRGEPAGPQRLVEQGAGRTVRQQPQAVEDGAGPAGQRHAADPGDLGRRQVLTQQPGTAQGAPVGAAHEQAGGPVGHGDPVPAGGGRPGEHRAVEGQQTGGVAQRRTGPQAGGREHRAEHPAPLAGP
ncbi:hypothetical protein [Polymorphospora rubra]|uniref:hypothetical protein n=1 Tax=Polymorphospora rubra TaxID=338584 RepID=UPI001BB3E6EC|nr:hypothetical protein [Polymorphospora rubra]